MRPVIPISLPFAGVVNFQAWLLSMSSDAMLRNQIKDAYAGDPMHGQNVSDTNKNWDDLSEVQKMIVLWWNCYASGPFSVPVQGTLEENLNLYPGPTLEWNNSYNKWKAAGVSI